jgi:ATP-dependent protease ClpP protease subunit
MKSKKIHKAHTEVKEVAKLYTQMDGTEANLFFYGTIGDVWADTGEDAITALNVRKELDKLIEKGAKTINIRINSMGGYTSEGLAIVTALKECTGAEIHTWNDGTAYSMAADIWFCAPIERRHMAKGATLMIHAPSSGVCFYGTAKELREAGATAIDQLEEIAKMLDSIAEGTMEIMAEGTGMTKEDILNSFYDYADHTLSFQECVKAGFIVDENGYSIEKSPSKTGIMNTIRKIFSPNLPTESAHIEEDMTIEKLKEAIKSGELTLADVSKLVADEQSTQPVTADALKDFEASMIKKIGEEVGKRDELITKLQADLEKATKASGGQPPVVPAAENEGAIDPPNANIETPEELAFKKRNADLVVEKMSGRV